MSVDWTIPNQFDHLPNKLIKCVVASSGGVHRVSFEGVYDTPPPCTLRGDIREFSRPARKRLTTFCRRIQWEFWKMGSFITLTYPDDVADRSAGMRNRDKYLFHRWLEKATESRVCGIWRLEEKERRTGRYKGKLVPHYHLLLMNVPYVGLQKIRVAWGSIIGCEKLPQCNVKRMKSPQHTAVYLCKYVAKVRESALLDCSAYLNKPGRQYGFLRKADIPLHPTTSVTVSDPRLMTLLEEFGAVELPWVHPGDLCGFDLFEGKAEQILQAIRDFMLDMKDDPYYKW